MGDSDSEQRKGFRILLPADRTTATLAIDAGAEVSAAAVIAELRGMNLSGYDDGAVIENIERRKGEAMSVVVATGKPPVDERPERLNYRVPVADGEICMIAKVETGQVVATIVPAIAGKDGIDVFGQPLACGKGRLGYEIGRNLQMEKGGIVATAPGNLRLSGSVLSVEPLLELRGTDGDSGSIAFDGDVVLKGSLNAGRNVQISGSLMVGGAIESVQLKTGGSVHAKGGMIDTHKGRFDIGGNLQCRFISGAIVTVGGEVQVQSEITHSRISCLGRLTVARGQIYGGAVAANGGISCQVLGHSNGTPTIIEAGNGTTFQSLFTARQSRIKANRNRIGEIRAKIEPLVEQMKQLNPKQREKVTELLFEANELEAETKRMAAELESQTQEVGDKERAEIVVTEIAHPGVTVCFPGIEALLAKSHRGSFTLAAEMSDGMTRIVLIDATSQSRSVLPSRPVRQTHAARAA